MEKATKIPLFRRCVIQNFPFIEEDFDALTDYGLLCKVVEYLNKVIEQTNTTSTQVEELSVAFNTLKDFVDHYFDNLDVQEEINNKLDEMAASGTLEEIMTAYFNGKMQLIFPIYGTDGDDTLGDCSIIKNGDKSLMIDTFSSITPEPYISIKQALAENNITTLTYLVISHYHGDHSGNLLYLLRDGYLDGCTVYLPRPCVSFPEYDDQIQDIKEALDLAGVEWIEINNQTFTLGEDCTVKMLNGSAADYQYYEDIEAGTANNSYNDRSIVCDIEYRGRKMLFTGDCEARACNHILPSVSSNYDFLKDMHHGFIDPAPTFDQKVNPEYVLVPASAGMVMKNFNAWLVNTPYWNRKTKNIAVQGYQNETVVYDVDVTGIKPVSNIVAPDDLAGQGEIVYYIDSENAGKVRTGSETEPFKTLQEALVFVPKNTVNRIKFKVLSISNVIANVVSGYKYLEIDFNNVAYDEDLIFRDIETLKIQKLDNGSHKITIQECNAEIRDYTSTNANITIINSKVRFFDTLNLTIDDYAGIDVNNSQILLGFHPTNSVITFANDTTKQLIGGGYSFISATDWLITDYLKTIKFFGQFIPKASYKTCKLSENMEDLKLLFSTNSVEYASGTLAENISNWSVLKVLWQDSSWLSGYCTIEKTHDMSISSIAHPSGTARAIRYAKIAFSGTTFTLSNNSLMLIDSANSGSIENRDGNYIGVLKIWGVE